MSFSVTGKHVVVAGGGPQRDRRGRVAARPRRARDAERHAASPRASPRCAASGVTVEIGPHRPALFARADLVVLSPGVPPDQEAMTAARRAGVPVIGEVELASRWLTGRVIAITGHEGQVDDDDADCAHAAGGGIRRHRRRQSRHRALRPGGDNASDGVARGGGQQLPARDHRHVPPVDCRCC